LQKSLGELPRKPASSEPRHEAAQESNVTPIKKQGGGPKRVSRTAHG